MNGASRQTAGVQDDTGVDLGLDLGTTDWVAVATDPAGRVVRTVRRRAPFDAAGVVEAEVALDVAHSLLDEAAGPDGADGAVAAVGAIGVTGMAEAVGAIREDRAVGEIHSWRSTAGPAAAEIRPGTPDLADRTGLPLGPVAGATAMRRLGDGFDGVTGLLPLPDLVVWSLTGSIGTVPSLAVRSGLLDRRGHRWIAELAAAAGIDSSTLPPVLERHEALGVHPGRFHGVPVVSVGHDHPTAAAAVGGDRPGTWVDSIGTVEVLLAVVERSDADTLLLPDDTPVAIGPHVLPGLAYVGIGVGMTGVALAEAATRHGGHVELDRAFLAGEPAAVALFDELATAADEALRALIDTLGTRPDRLMATGNGARSAALLASRAERLGVVLTAPAVPEAAAVGAARLARRPGA